MTFLRWTIGCLALWIAACGGSATATKSDTPAEKSAGTIEDGEALIAEGDFEGAASLFRNLLAQTPDDAVILYYLGLSERNLGDLAAAAGHYEKALEKDPKLMDARINLGLLLLDTGDLNGAEHSLKIYLDAAPERADAHFNYGMVLEAMGNLDGAEKEYREAARLDPEDASPLFGLGDIARSRKKFKEAVDLYDRALALDPEMPALRYIKGETLMALNRPADACETFKGILKTERPDPAEIVEAGKQIAPSDGACATHLYRGALAIDDGFAAAHFYLANTLARESDFASAATHYERFLALAPEDPAAPEAEKRLAACKSRMK